jgi:V/A-type H+/Na+-transporting ATPase subunit D
VSADRLPATRLELLRGRQRLARVAKGRDLLRKKREALVRELLRQVRPAAEERATIATQAEEAYEALLAALAEEGEAGLEPYGWPPRRLQVDVEPAVVWGVAAPRIASLPRVRRTLAARMATPSGGASTAAADAFESLLERLLAAASRELLIARLGAALATAARQVRTLEQRVAPRLAAELVRVERSLDEREREERVRIRHLLGRRPR